VKSEFVLVTGASGLLGHSLAERLATAGRAVVGMDRNGPAEKPKFPFVPADLNDIDVLHRTLKEFAVTAIAHCGGVSGRVAAGDDPFALLEINVRGTSVITEAARRFGVTRLVFCSSAAAYGRDVAPVITEEHPLHATTVYGASKTCGEAIIRSYAAQYGLDAVALRIFQVFGPRRTTECYIRLMIENALLGRRTKIAHAATSRRQYVYVDDVVDALLLALDRRKLPRLAYNVSGESSLTLSEVAGTVASLVPGVEVEFGQDTAGDQYRIQQVDLSVAKSELGYYPRISLREGIARYAEWLKRAA
jgi:nucleoside-diphosphate-sugar epimerase